METRFTLVIQSFHKTPQNDRDEKEEHNRTAVMADRLTLCMLISYVFSQIE